MKEVQKSNHYTGFFAITDEQIYENERDCFGFIHGWFLSVESLSVYAVLWIFIEEWTVPIEWNMMVAYGIGESSFWLIMPHHFAKLVFTHILLSLGNAGW